MPPSVADAIVVAHISGLLLPCPYAILKHNTVLFRLTRTKLPCAIMSLPFHCLSDWHALVSAFRLCLCRWWCTPVMSQGLAQGEGYGWTWKGWWPPVALRICPQPLLPLREARSATTVSGSFLPACNAQQPYMHPTEAVVQQFVKTCRLILACS